jgi:hypothetical protein
MTPEIKAKIGRIAQEESLAMAGVFIPNRIDSIEPFSFRLRMILEKFYSEVIAEDDKFRPNLL